MYTRIQSFHTYAYKLCVHIYKLCIIRIKKEKKNQKTVKTKVKKKNQNGDTRPLSQRVPPLEESNWEKRDYAATLEENGTHRHRRCCPEGKAFAHNYFTPPKKVSCHTPAATTFRKPSTRGHHGRRLSVGRPSRRGMTPPPPMRSSSIHAVGLDGERMREENGSPLPHTSPLDVAIFCRQRRHRKRTMSRMGPIKEPHHSP